MKRYLKNILMVTLVTAFIFNISSCKKDEDDNNNNNEPTLGTIENIEFEKNQLGVSLSWDAYTGAHSYLVSVAGIVDSDLPLTSTSYIIDGDVVNGAELKITAFSDASATTLIAKGIVIYEEDTTTNSELVQITEADVLGNWESSNSYYKFEEGGSGEYGTVSAISGNEKEYDITWEITTCTIDEINFETGSITEKTVRCIKPTDPEGFYDELEVVKEGDIFKFIDHTNNRTYLKVGGNSTNNFDDYVTIPGIIETENYINGGEGVGYHDSEGSNQGGKYREDGVDIDLVNGTNHYVGWTMAGEWLKYNINVTSTGEYHIKFTSASQTGGSIVTLKVDDQEILSSFQLPQTYNWSLFEETLSTTVNLTAGNHVLKIEFVSSGSNLDKIEIIQGAGLPLYNINDFMSSDWSSSSGSTLHFNYDGTGFANFAVEGFSIDFSSSEISTHETYGESILIESYGQIYIFKINSLNDLTYYNSIGNSETFTKQY